MLDALQQLAGKRGQPWQTVMKELLTEALELQPHGPATYTYHAPHLFDVPVGNGPVVPRYKKKG